MKYPVWVKITKTTVPSYRTTTNHRLSKQPCLETDGVRECVEAVYDELHICHSQEIGPQTVQDYKVEKMESVRI